MMTQRLARLAIVALGLSASLSIVACTHTHIEEATESDAWAVTAWGELFEVFAETDPLVVGQTVKSHTHVTILDGFSPMREGKVSIVLRDGSGEAVFTEESPIRDGIYSIPIKPEREGEFDLIYRIATPGGAEEIAGGRILVTGTEGNGGGLIEATEPTLRAERSAAAETPISFLKEQQWRTTFATEWVGASTLSEAIRAPARVVPVAGGEVLLTAPVDGVVGRTDWPYAGLDVGRHQQMFEIVPRIGAAKSLAELAAMSASLEAELALAKQRRVRLEELLAIGAASQAEVDRARSRETILVAQSDASGRDLSTARATRQGTEEGTGAQRVAITAPFPARVAEVAVTPGQTVQAGDPVARLVRARPVWLEVGLTPGEARRLPTQSSGLVVSGLGLGSGESGDLAFTSEQTRLVSVAPGVDPRTGTVRALFEVDTTVDELRLGVAADVDILLGEETVGVVVPASALVDDSGVTVAYLQLDGEGFARIEVDVVYRRSGRVLVERIPLGSRLVTMGGSAIRRATLVAADPGEGHVH